MEDANTKKGKERRTMIYTLCDNCPCLNRDIEDGCECNLDYCTSYEIVDEDKNTWAYISNDCQMVEILTTNAVIVPEKINIISRRKCQ